MGIRYCAIPVRLRSLPQLTLRRPRRHVSRHQSYGVTPSNLPFSIWRERGRAIVQVVTWVFLIKASSSSPYLLGLVSSPARAASYRTNAHRFFSWIRHLHNCSSTEMPEITLGQIPYCFPPSEHIIIIISTIITSLSNFGHKLRHVLTNKPRCG